MAEGLDISVRLDRRDVNPERTRKVHAAVRIVAPPAPATAKRAPLDLVACIDISGSMQGEKLRRAKHSLRKLVEQLAPGDRLGIVAFESNAHRVFASAPMTSENKDIACRDIDRLHTMGSTNMSAGLEASLAMLTDRSEKPETNAVRRVLLFTDGHANHGLREGDLYAWSALIRTKASNLSISWFGYGEDHSADFLSSLADVSRGNYYRTENEDAIVDAFAREIGGLLSVVARGIQVRARPEGGAGALALLNDETSRMDGEWLSVEIPDIYSEEQRWVVFELTLPAAGAPGQRRLIEFELGWTWAAAGRRDSISLSGAVELVEIESAGGDGEVLEQVAILRAAQLQRQAAQLAERGDFTQARDLVLQAAQLLAGVEGRRARALERALRETAELYGDPRSFRGNRSRLLSVRRSMGKMRSSGSEFDAYFDSGAQTRMVAEFKEGASGERSDADTPNDPPRTRRRSPTKH